jgi:hypothetical protein
MVAFGSNETAALDPLIGEARDRQRKRRLATAVVLAVVFAVALTVSLNRGSLGLDAGSRAGSSSTASNAWRPTEDRLPYRVRNSNLQTARGAEQDFYVMHPQPAGTNLLRYADRGGWSILYPHRFHAVAYSVDPPPLIGPPQDMPPHIQGASFANYQPVPTSTGPRLVALIPAHGVLFQLTALLCMGCPAAVQAMRHEGHSPLALVNSIRTRSVGAARSGSFAFQANGHIYQAAFWAGQNASNADLYALEKIVRSVRFAPLKPGSKTGPFSYLWGEPLPSPGA